jgi:4-amino-4-deoxy-L-arabinose transferase-like glycosyltransferase
MVWFNATLIVAAGGMLAVPDVGASLFWTLCLWCLVRAQGDLKRPGLWWALAGLVAGLATLSKYSSLFLAPGIFLWVVVSADRRKVLATPWPWLAGLIAGLVFATNVYWNAQHGWLTFAKQFGRVEANGFSPKFVVELVITQAVLLNPLITGLLVRGAAAQPKADLVGQRLDLSLLWLTSLPFAAYLMIHALHDRVQGHWPMPLYAGLALAAALLTARLELGRVARACRILCLGLALALAPWP